MILKRIKTSQQPLRFKPGPTVSLSNALPLELQPTTAFRRSYLMFVISGLGTLFGLALRLTTWIIQSKSWVTVLRLIHWSTLPGSVERNKNQVSGWLYFFDLHRRWHFFSLKLSIFRFFDFSRLDFWLDRGPTFLVTRIFHQLECLWWKKIVVGTIVPLDQFLFLKFFYLNRYFFYFFSLSVNLQQQQRRQRRTVLLLLCCCCWMLRMMILYRYI